MNLVLAMALAVLAADGPNVTAASHRCSAVVRVSGWVIMSQASVASDGRVEPAIFVALPRVVSVEGVPAGRDSPQLAFITAWRSEPGFPSTPIPLISVSTVEHSDKTGPDWTGQLLADGVELASGRMVWGKEFTVPSLMSTTEGSAARSGRFVIDHPPAKMLEGIGKAQDVTAIIKARGRAPWIVRYGKLDLSGVQAGQDKALDLVRRAAQGPGIWQFPDYSWCKSGEPASQPALPLKMPSLPQLPNLPPGY